MVQDFRSEASRETARDYSRLASTAFSREQTAITALVVGAGALGNEVIKNLALLGVERIWIADRDIIESSNLTRSILYCTTDIDQQIANRTPKAVYAATRVHEINRDVSATAFVGEIADLGLGVIRRADVVFSCLDNEMARLELGWACSRLRKLLVDGGLGVINYSSGQVTVFPPEGGPCFACRASAARRRELLQELQGREDPCWRTREALDAVDMVATTPLMSSMVGALQVELGLRAFRSGAGDALGHAYRLTVHPNVSVESASFERSPNCALHDPASLVTTLVEDTTASSDRWTPLDVLRAANADRGSLVLDWPITVKAICQNCRHEWAPFARRARFRRQACPACASRDIAELDVMSSIDAESPWAGRTLASLGFPRGNIYEVARDTQTETDRLHVELSGDLSVMSHDRAFARVSG